MASDIRASELASLTHLDASNRGIIDLTGLENAINLRSLNLSNNKIGSLAALAPKTSTRPEDAGSPLGLAKLEHFAFDNNSNESFYGSGVMAYNPVAFYRLNETSGSFIRDSSGRNNHGTLVGSAIQGVPGADPNDKAIDFNGTGSVQLNVPQINTAAGGKNTVSFWWKTDGNGNQDMPFAFNQELYLYQVTPADFGFGAGGGIEGAGRFVNISQYFGQWIQVTAVFENGNLDGCELYINGAKQTLSRVGAQNPNSSQTAITNATISGWAFNNGHVVDGEIDDLAIFNRALTESEIINLAAARRELRGLAQLQNLQSLSMDHTSIGSLQPLSQSSKLERFSVDRLDKEKERGQIQTWNFSNNENLSVWSTNAPGGVRSVAIPNTPERFLGRDINYGFGNETVTLDLGDREPGQYSIGYDLYLINSWDGNHPTVGDRWRLSVRGQSGALLDASFSQFHHLSQSYPLNFCLSTKACHQSHGRES